MNIQQLPTQENMYVILNCDDGLCAGKMSIDEKWGEPMFDDMEIFGPDQRGDAEDFIERLIARDRLEWKA